jgi:hypothetical protein
MPAQRIRGPLILLAVSIALAIALNAGFTYWAIGWHSRQSCAELQILALTRGARTPYEQKITRAYGRLYQLRCG